MDIYASEHAKKRVSKRCGVPKRSVDRLAAIAHESGIKSKDATGALRMWIDQLRHYKGTETTVRIHAGFAYLYRDNLLITVLQTPTNLKKQSENAQRKKRGEEPCRRSQGMRRSGYQDEWGYQEKVRNV